MTDMPALIEEDIDEEEDVRSSTENYFDPLTHIPGPTKDDNEELRYSRRKRRPTQRYGEYVQTTAQSGHRGVLSLVQSRSRSGYNPHRFLPQAG